MSLIARTGPQLALIAPPLCGNQQLAEAMANKFEVPFLSTSKILQHHLKDNTLFGQKVKLYLSEGVPIPHKLVEEIALEALNKCPKGYLIEGFPMTTVQATALHSKFKWPHVIYLSTKNDHDTIIGKIAAQVACTSCGPLFNQISTTEEMEVICNSCKGSDFIKQREDRRKVAEDCLEIFRKKTIPVLKLYEDHGRLTRVDTGTETVDEIYRRVTESI